MVHQECVRGWGYSNSLNTCKPPCNLLQSTVCCPCVLWHSFYVPVRWEGSSKLFLVLHLLPSSKMFFFNVCNRIKYVLFQDIFWVWQKKKEFTSILFSWYFMCWAEWNIEIIYSFFIYPLNEHLVNGAPEKQVTKICFHVWKGRKKKSFHVSKIFFPCVKTSISSKWTFLGNFALKFSQEILF